MESQKIILFQEKQVRREWYLDDWYFSIVDVIEVLTDATQPRTYWAKLKKKIKEESELLPNWQQLKMKSADGKFYKTDVANTEGLLRIIMSIPSPKAEPFKLWLAQIGKERIEEIENPELAFERAAKIYRAKGYTEEWIERRKQSINARKRLTDEWKSRGVQEGQEYAILTAEIAKATFGLTPSEHGKLKGLEKQNLRDHMTPLELIFTALGEEATRILAMQDDAKGFVENRETAEKGGRVAGKARRNAEKDLNIKVVSPENYLHLGHIETKDIEAIPEKLDDKDIE
jgi:DNA-damage-inducible protein D